MSKKLRLRFIAIASLSVFIVLFSFLVCINVWNYSNMTDNADRTLSVIAENNGTFPKVHKDKPKSQPIPENKTETEGQPVPSKRMDFTPEDPFSTRYFSVTLTEDLEQTGMNLNNIAAISIEEATQMTNSVMEKGKTKGFWGAYRYCITELDEGKMVVFLDCTKDLFFMNNFLLNSIYVGGAGFFAVCLLIIIFSKTAVRPMTESYEKQKTFITNAGHELKTPLSIIDANTEVIEMEHGESQWTQSIKHQIERLTRLTNQLTTLAKMEEGQVQISMESLDFSQIITEVCDEMEACAQGQDKTIQAAICPKVMVNGNEDQLRQLIYILLDNSVKHSKENSPIEVALSSGGKLTIKNKAYLEKTGNMNILLQRFYRTDASRSRQTGGYGLGLSIANAIVEQHRGKISIMALNEDTLEITITLR
ncbi:phosphate regulon sensor protein PhoR [Anaerotignum neopropionicum]|uniref:histidine kinase n=1 Tax=Anaerotignum neopropionicum TaxID=36847 RepID=A0A136WI93_9FIRM|nr:HAMP domain-containing sensor histidine kinase [Anaerotignum neopropionicum]KXL54174.1 phosphate regulon sensor protein PhoR [Anaerotignum neopropionicum]KXL54299.1 phosphate regulon sensor protein PhoR [Anaerotignum neopropionicum]